MNNNELNNIITESKLTHFFFQISPSVNSKTYIPIIEFTTPLEIIGFQIESVLVKITSNSTFGISFSLLKLK